MPDDNQQQNQGQAGAAGQGQGAGAQGGETPPFWAKLPDNMKGASAEETLQKLMPSWEGYHKQATERQAGAAKTADDFKFESQNEKLGKYFANPKDPMLTAAREVALEAGLPVAKFSAALEKVFGPMVDKGLIAPPMDIAADYAAKAKLLGHDSLSAEAKTALEAKETEMTAFASNFGKQLGLSEAGQVELESLALTPGGFELLMKLPGALGKSEMRMGGAPPAAPKGKEEVFAMLNDERANSLSRKFDPEFRKQAEAAYEALRAAA